MKKAIISIFSVLLIDQIIKIIIKTHFFLGQEFHVLGDWFILHFTENNGMAYGMEFGGSWGKIFLSVFRIIAVSGIGWYLWASIKRKENDFYIICISLIFAGALGNIVDSAFYGVLFSDSNFDIARFLPEEGGYSSFLHGKVVDMFYFPLIETHYPSWFPLWANEEFVFFRPVFNFADASISIGVLLIVLFQKRFFGKKDIDEISTTTPEVTTEQEA